MNRFLYSHSWKLFFLLIILSVNFVWEMPQVVLQTGILISSLFCYKLAHLNYSRLPQNHNLNIKLFDINLLFAFLFFMIQSFWSSKQSLAEYIGIDYGIPSLVLIGLLQWLAGFATFYCLYFTAKCIGMAQMQRNEI